MTALMIDASVAVKWFLPEERSDEALVIRDGFIEGDSEPAEAR
jgi:predicted nucleic acid-binding protein